MANKKEQTENNVPVEVKTKQVRNRSNGKIELLINGKIVIFPPKATVEVPKDFEVPNGIGLYVK